MPLEMKTLERVFRISINGAKTDLSDPDPDRTPDQVMALYAHQYPQLTTATVTGPTFEDDKALYEIKTSTGTKG